MKQYRLFTVWHNGGLHLPNCCSCRLDSNFSMLVPSSDWFLYFMKTVIYITCLEKRSGKYFLFYTYNSVLVVLLKIILFVFFQPWVSWSKPCSEWEKLQQPQLWERTESWVSGTTICCEFIQFFPIMNSIHSMSYCMNLVLSFNET